MKYIKIGGVILILWGIAMVGVVGYGSVNTEFIPTYRDILIKAILYSITLPGIGISLLVVGKYRD